MDIATVGQAGGFATGGAIFVKILDKIPWSRLWGKNGNGNGSGPVSSNGVKVLIGDHQRICMDALNPKFDKLSADIKSVEKTIVDMLMQDRENR